MPSPDAVQEVRVSTNTYDAQFGRTGGGVIAVSIRSGTNTFRGTGYYNHRAANLSSNLYENNVRGIPKDDLYHYNPGFTFGGPVRLPKYDGRSKTFFFYAFEGLKSGIPVSSGERAPTDLERAGDFSQSGAIIYDPLNTVNGVPQPFPGNRIPANRMDPVARQPAEVHGDAELAARRDAEQLLRGEQLALRHLHVGHHPRRSQLRRQPPLLRALRPQRPARDARQERPRRGGADGRLSPPLEQRAQRRPERPRSGRRCCRARASAGRVIAGWTSAARKTRAGSIWPRSASRRSYTSALPQRFPPIRVNDYAGASIGQGGGQDGPSDDFYVQEVLTKIAGKHQLKFGARIPLRHQHGGESARRASTSRTCSSRATSRRCVRTSRP